MSDCLKLSFTRALAFRLKIRFVEFNTLLTTSIGISQRALALTPAFDTDAVIELDGKKLCLTLTVFTEAVNQS